MSKIKIGYGKENYTLEYDRESVEHMIENGLTIERIRDNPFSWPDLFYGAFRKHHPFVARKTTDEMWKELPNKTDMVAGLANLFAEPINALVEEPKEQGNVTWEISD